MSKNNIRYIGGHVSISGGLSLAINNTLRIGGNCLQIFAGSPRLWSRKPFSKDEVSKFLKAQKRHQIGPVFIHALYLINLGSADSNLLEKSVNSLIVDIQNGASIHSSGVIIHIGSHLGAGFAAVKSQVINALKKILTATKDCDLILENSAGQNGKIGSIEELSILIQEVKSSRIKICLDTAHLFASGVDLRSQADVSKLITKLKDLQLLQHLTCLHLNDSASELGSRRDLHANIGEGKLGINGLKNFVNQQDLCHLPLILEVPGANKQGPDSNNITIVRKLVIN